MKWVYSSDTVSILSAQESLIEEILILPQNRPAFFENYDRSHAWVLYRQLIRTKAQFDEVLKQAAKCLAGSIKGDDESAKEVERLFVEEANKILQKIISLLEQLLRQPPRKGGAKSQYFKEDDCSNTSSDPDKPPTLSKQIPSTQNFVWRAESVHSKRRFLTIFCLSREE